MWLTLRDQPELIPGLPENRGGREQIKASQTWNIRGRIGRLLVGEEFIENLGIQRAASACAKG